MSTIPSDSASEKTKTQSFYQSATSGGWGGLFDYEALVVSLGAYCYRKLSFWMFQVSSFIGIKGAIAAEITWCVAKLVWRTLPIIVAKRCAKLIASTGVFALFPKMITDYAAVGMWGYILWDPLTELLKSHADLVYILGGHSWLFGTLRYLDDTHLVWQATRTGYWSIDIRRIFVYWVYPVALCCVTAAVAGESAITVGKLLIGQLVEHFQRLVSVLVQLQAQQQ